MATSSGAPGAPGGAAGTKLGPKTGSKSATKATALPAGGPSGGAGSEDGGGGGMLGWSDDLATGDINIDSQHWYIVKLINEIREAHVRVRDRAALIVLFEKLLGFLRLHFRYEEKLLKRLHYEGLKVLATDHASLLTQAEAVLAYARAERVIESRFVTMLLYGLLSHIRSEADLRPLISAARRNEAAG